MGQVILNRDELRQTDVGAEALRYIDLLEQGLDVHLDEMARLRAENLCLLDMLQGQKPTEDFLL